VAATPKKEQGGSEVGSEEQGEDPLEDEVLIRMEPSTSEEPEDILEETQNGSNLDDTAKIQKQKGTLGLGASAGPGARPGGLPHPPVHLSPLILL
jgi:hypothetical protein